MKCDYHLKDRNEDGTSTAVCVTHGGNTFEYGDPRVIMYHLCPIGLREELGPEPPRAEPLPPHKDILVVTRPDGTEYIKFVN